MLTDRDTYLKLCETHNIPTDENVLKALTTSSATTALNLKGCSLTNETCDLISNLLINSTNIHDVNLSDCLLPPRGLSSLLKSLSQMSSVTHLDLKGNNISGNSIIKLGAMLKNNTSIKVLNLEWNSLGLFPDAFKEFCLGIAKNSFLLEIDLQNNQLSTECAAMLSDALAQNNTLKVIDLRWNELGCQGGQYIYQALQNNSSLSTIRLQGNCIPSDVAQVIERCATHNQSRQEVIQQCAARNHLLAKHVRRLEAKKSLEIEGLAKRNEEIVKETEIRLSSVEEALTEKNVALANMQVELKAIKVEKRKFELLNSQLQEQLQEIQSDCKLRTDQYYADIERLKKKYKEEEEATARKVKSLEQQLNEEQRQRISLQENIVTAEKEICHLQAEQTSRLEAERHQHSEQVAILQKQQEERINRIQKDCDDKIREYKVDASRIQQRLNERIRALETNVFDLEKKLSEQSAEAAAMSQEIARSAETIAAAAHEAKEKELMRLKVLEDRLDATRNEKLSVEKQLEVSHRTIHQLQEQNNVLVSELSEPQRKISRLHEELTREREIISRLRTELTDEMNKADARKSDVDRLQVEVNSLTQQLSEMKSASAANELEWHREREKLTSQISQKEKEIQSMRSEEVERATALYTAFTKYLGKLHP